MIAIVLRTVRVEGQSELMYSNSQDTLEAIMMCSISTRRLMRKLTRQKIGGDMGGCVRGGYLYKQGWLASRILSVSLWLPDQAR
jgi:hypothetical protein